MAMTVQMPKQGNTVVECLLVEWKVAEGDRVSVGDALCAIETDKAAFEVQSTAEGTILRLLAKAGDLVPILTDIAVIGEPGESVLAAGPAPAAGAEKTGTFGSTPPPAAAKAGPSPSPVAASSVSGQSGSKVSPRGRKLAEKLGVNPSGLAGSGPDGRIISRDIQAAVDDGRLSKASPLAREIMASDGRVAVKGSGVGGLILSGDLKSPADAALPEAPEAEERIPYQGIRKLIGDRMLQSLERQAQLTLNVSADATGLLALSRHFKENAGAAGLPNITLNDLVCWAVAGTLPAYPEVNAVFDREGGAIVRHRRVNLAVAVDTARGLMVPVVADAQRLSLAGLSRLISQYAADCRKGSINPDLLSGGTFTISNLGNLGVESFTPIINSPQAAILGVCAVRETPMPAPGGGLAFQPRLGLSLTIDHQLVDGAPAARFLQALVKAIEDIQAGLALLGAV